jgi:hypothetical protein
MKKLIKRTIKNVAYIQDSNLLTQEQIKKYMNNVKYLSSFNSIKIYNFIVCCNKCYKITNFCLTINSKSLTQLNILIKKNRKLDNCNFIATYSNADLTREITEKNIYFALSSLNTILENYSTVEPFNIMTIVSNVKSPFFDQIYKTGPKPAYRMSELTVEKVNEFIDKGNGIDLVIALDYIEDNEYKKLNEILLNPLCKYKNFATFIELTNRNIPLVNKLNKKLASIDNIASNVSINGMIDVYPDVDYLYLYINCAIQLVNTYKEWPNYIKNAIVFNRFTKKIEISQISPSVFPFPRPRQLLTTMQTVSLRA